MSINAYPASFWQQNDIPCKMCEFTSFFLHLTTIRSDMIETTGPQISVWIQR